MIRQKVINCGSGRKSKFIEVDLFPYFGKPIKGGRGKKHVESCPKQKNLNNKNAKRYFNQLAKSNFNITDYHTSLTYSKENMPGSVEEAEKIVTNYFRRLKRLRAKKGLPPLKYLLVTEIGQRGKIHHHVIMNGGLSRDEVEDLWRKLGYANTDRLQFDAKGIEGLCNYLCKDPQGKRRWKQSKNLIKPWYRTPTDGKYSKQKIEQMAKLPQDSEEIKCFWEKQYRGYQLDESRAEFNTSIGQWSIYLKMSLKERS